ncbi:helix-turn-helix transcriptional regulator [Flavobacterium sp. J27]|uniref:helix-turn-helix transcriptional regulator n=1 Tax=Flavobacterium sp. J27 TaxID=2060419 RepID=UPI0010321E2E|nr:helix-turn-helix domain-containing protein [Flavobacterium sp. J27]
MKNIPVRHISNIPIKEPVLFGNFNIRDIQSLLDGNDMVENIHRHDFFLIIVLFKGEGSHTIDFNPYPISERNVFFIRPGQVHELNLSAKSKGFLIQFDSQFYYPEDENSRLLLRRVGNKNYYQFEEIKFNKLYTIIENILLEYNDKQSEYENVIKANLGIFFTELIRNRNILECNSDIKNIYEQERLEEFVNLLETNLKEFKQVSKYAEMLNLSTYQLNAITKTTLGKTCSELINEQIILEAKRFLLATTNQVKEIAFNLGYDDVSYFVRFFKKHTGYSPETFRKNFK